MNLRQFVTVNLDGFLRSVRHFVTDNLGRFWGLGRHFVTGDLGEFWRPFMHYAADRFRQPSLFTLAHPPSVTVLPARTQSGNAQDVCRSKHLVPSVESGQSARQWVKLGGGLVSVQELRKGSWDSQLIWDRCQLPWSDLLNSLDSFKYKCEKFL